jgi:hypothetical protein
LQGDEFADARKNLTHVIEGAAQQARAGNAPRQSDLKDMRACYEGLNNTLRNHVSDLSPTDYIVAQRYLRQVGDAITALEDPDVDNFFNQNWTPKGQNVAELIRYMSDNGLEFAPAVPGQEGAYRAMYNALSQFDAGMQGAQK